MSVRLYGFEIKMKSEINFLTLFFDLATLEIKTNG